MAEKVTADIGFEKQIWDAACVLRGNMDASEYKNVVLGLIFLKYISDRFEAKYQELVDEGDGFEVLRQSTRNWSMKVTALRKTLMNTLPKVFSSFLSEHVGAKLRQKPTLLKLEL